MDDSDKYGQFFKGLGRRIRDLRLEAGYSQEDMMGFGWSRNQWQEIEGGRAITMKTMLRICEVFGRPMHRIVKGLDDYICGS